MKENNKIKKIFHFIAHIEYKDNLKKIIIFNKINIKITNSRREAFAGYMFILIWLIGFIWLTAYPLFMSLRFSFSDVKITGDEGTILTFIGIDNFKKMVVELEYLDALKNFVVQIVLYLPIVLIVSIIISMLLNRKFKLRGFFRSVFFLPVIISSGPIIATLLGTSGREGLLQMTMDKNITEALVNYIPEFAASFISLLFNHLTTILWFSGVQILLFLAGLQKMNQEIYEAAQIDGASPWETFWKITLPSLKSIILVNSVYTIVMLSTISTNSVLTKINQVRNSSFGYASALSWIYFLVVGLLLGIVTFMFTYERKRKEVKVLRSIKR